MRQLAERSAWGYGSYVVRCAAKGVHGLRVRAGRESGEIGVLNLVRRAVCALLILFGVFAAGGGADCRATSIRTSQT